MIKLSIIIVSYNTNEMTCACIRSIYDQTQINDFEIVVVDNDSNDGSADSIASEFPKVRLVRSPENLGFARANNLAAADAYGAYLLLLNPDTLILDHAIDRLMEFAHTRPAAKIWGGKTLFGDKSLNPKSCWRFMSLWSIFAQSVGLAALFPDNEVFNHEGYGGWMRHEMREVDIVSGCFFLIDRNLWNDLGGFDESYFMYCEEADLCFRAQKLGARPATTPEATIVHYGGASERVFGDKVVRLYSGKIHFLRKHWPVPKRKIGVALFELSAATRALAYSVAALLTRKVKHRATAGEWRNVLLRRREWTKGYLTDKNPS